MRPGGWTALLATAVALTVLADQARAATHDVSAAGNTVAGGLAFEPAATTGAVGDTVRWTNTDYLVPHTATEVHGLFNLTGSYGGTPANPPGFGPGEVRERVFEAGTFEYFCQVHPVAMRGTVTVAPQVKRVRVGGKRRLRVTWAAGPPAPGQAYDVERRRDGNWTVVLDGTTLPSAKFVGKRKSKFRARLRSASDPSLASGYSPAVGP